MPISTWYLMFKEYSKKNKVSGRLCRFLVSDMTGGKIACCYSFSFLMFGPHPAIFRAYYSLIYAHVSLLVMLRGHEPRSVVCKARILLTLISFNLPQKWLFFPSHKGGLKMYLSSWKNKEAAENPRDICKYVSSLLLKISWNLSDSKAGSTLVLNKVNLFFFF